MDDVPRYRAWALTWISYATYYMGRKNFSVAKPAIIAELGKHALTPLHLGGSVRVGVETAYLATYALGQWISGTIGDRIGARRLIGFGMILSAAACIAFGSLSAGMLMLSAFAANGFFQSTGWPGNVKAMAEWTTPENRGAVMGVWATCYQVGGLVATWVAAASLKRLGWRPTFWVTALILAAVGVLILVMLEPGPGSKKTDAAAGRARVVTPEARAAQRAVLRSSTIWLYGASYFFIKLIRYSFIFSLPLYLATVLRYSTDDAGYLSTSFEIGGIAGCIGLGRLSDRYRRWSRSIWSSLSLVALAGALVLFTRVGGMGWMAAFASMALIGALLFGPDALLSGAAAQDAGGPHAAAMAAGMVNAIGSVGGFLQEAVTHAVSDSYGWNALFVLFAVFSLAAALSLAPTFRHSPISSGQANA